MTELTTASGPPDVLSEPTTAPLRVPVLITEQQVLLGSAAAVAFPRRSTAGRIADVFHRVMAGMRTAVSITGADRNVPARYSYIDNARMAREMDRL
jgi:hypothetical protein